MFLTCRALALTVGLACAARPRPAAAAAGGPCTADVAAGADLQPAIERAAAGRRGAVVCLGPGDFRLRRFLALRDGIVLRGAGEATVLRLDDGTQSPVIVIGDWERRVPRRPTSDVTIERLRIVAGGPGGSELVPTQPWLTNSAIVVRAGRNVAIRDVAIDACRSACILTEHGTRAITIERVDVGGSVWDGIALNRTSGARIVGNRVHDHTAAGITCEHLTDSVVADNAVDGNRTHGVYLSDSYGNTFTRNTFAANVLSGVFLACAVRSHRPVVRCWPDSMSAGNVFAANRFVDDRVGFMVGTDSGSPCTGAGFVRNRSRDDVFVRTPRQDPRATVFGRCVAYERRGTPSTGAP